MGVGFQVFREMLRRFLRATDKQVKPRVRPVDEFLAWLDDYTIKPLINLEKNDDVKKNYGSLRNIFLEVLDNDEDDRLRAIALAYFIRTAPAFEPRQHERDWIAEHYGPRIGVKI